MRSSPRTARARFDSVWTPAPSLAGLPRRSSSAPDWRYERPLEMAARCRELLAERHEVVTAPDQATLVTFRVEGDAAEVATTLYEAGVIVRDVPGKGRGSARRAAGGRATRTSSACSPL